MVYCYTFKINFLQIFGKSFHKNKKGDIECEIWQILNYGIHSLFVDDIYYYVCIYCGECGYSNLQFYKFRTTF